MANICRELQAMLKQIYQYRWPGYNIGNRAILLTSWKYCNSFRSFLHLSSHIINNVKTNYKTNLFDVNSYHFCDFVRPERITSLHLPRFVHLRGICYMSRDVSLLMFLYILSTKNINFIKLMLLNARKAPRKNNLPLNV